MKEIKDGNLSLTSRPAMWKQVIFYVFTLVVCALAIILGIRLGSSVESVGAVHPESTSGEYGWIAAFDSFSDSVAEHTISPIGLLLLQIIVILSVARFVGWIFNRIGQPTVIGEILSGIILGPSLLGAVWPEAFQFLFPEHSLGSIGLLSEIGLILFMFAIGMELSLKEVKQKFRSSLIISHAGICLPFALGVWLSFYTYEQYAMSQTSFLPYALFVGVAMSITAFPVLARIIQERRLGRTHLGSLALNTAATGDITAWLILAAVMAISSSGSMLSSVYNFVFLLLYLLVMFFVIQPFFSFVSKIYDNTEVVGKSMVGIIFILLIVSSYVTDLLSMHAIFGAFIMGLVMPDNLKFRHLITEKVEDVSLSFFLPLFFASSGLATQVGLINTASLWILFLIFTLVAIFGKVVGTYVAARAVGETRKDSLYLGAFMNTRGLMELVVLALGFDLGILPPVIFTILVLMTLVTTFMTTPLISLINAGYRRLEKRKKRLSNVNRVYQSAKVLISFGRPASGALLLRLADQLTRRGKDIIPDVTALHITPHAETNPIMAARFKESSFTPMLEESQRLGTKLKTQYELSDHPEQMIVEVAEEGNYGLLLVGGGVKHSGLKSHREVEARRSRLKRRIGGIGVSAGESLLAAAPMLRDKMSYFFSHVSCSVGVLIDRGFSQPKNILLQIGEESDIKLLPYARTMAENNGAKLSILPTSPQIDLQGKLHGTESLLSAELLPTTSILQDYDFIILSRNRWNFLSTNDVDAMAEMPSTLVLSLHC
ncbi:cation:proton antiporter domain-containing protein [Porphyromonas crevioricanis]|uniref:cation:proton antiporter domain-containing protein n=1 Tax=Porphyromonas crevioricanis TaxID=393921 RepID=UPI000B1A1A98|nr:cation:proton antiporter [Porphyromonas crevioricanis]